MYSFSKKFSLAITFCITLSAPVPTASRFIQLDAIYKTDTLANRIATLPFLVFFQQRYQLESLDSILGHGDYHQINVLLLPKFSPHAVQVRFQLLNLGLLHGDNLASGEDHTYQKDCDRYPFRRHSLCSGGILASIW
jgi:hypothetical protein